MTRCAICQDPGRLRRGRDCWICVDAIGCVMRARIRLGFAPNHAKGMAARERKAARTR